jgi:histone acetyltransferase (RNA polymerase elongator complex component)
VIHRIPTLKVLDFQRIKQEERDHAKQLYGELSLLSQKEKLAKMSKKEKIKVVSNVTAVGHREGEDTGGSKPTGDFAEVR